jgi:hypothetical protein
VGHRAEGEREFVDRPGVANQRFDEIAGADVVHEVSKELVTERVVAQVLNDRSAVGEGTRTLHIGRRRLRKSLAKERYEEVVPGGVDH